METETNNKKVLWNGDAHLANQIFGESYGVDWSYCDKKTLSINVKGIIIRVGDAIQLP